MKILRAPWFIAVLGGVAYLATTAVCFSTAKWHVPEPEAERASAGFVGESWDFYNPDLDKMIEEVKREHEALNTREQQLRDLEARLASERQELGAVTSMVARLQREIEQTVVRVKQDEVPNLKKLAKIHAAMSPEGSANLLKEQTDEEVLKVLFYLKPGESGPILEAFGRLGKTEAQRAAQLSERLRKTIEGAAPK